MTSDIVVRPANEATWDDLQTVLGPRGEGARCQCRWFQTPSSDWRETAREERAAALRRDTHCGEPDAPTTSGLVAWLDGEPAGWCAVEPRTAYPRLRTARVPWSGRDEDKDDDGVWAVVCFVTRAGYRRRGVSAALTAAAVEHARSCGARAVEGYPMVVEPGYSDSWGELYVGVAAVFEAAGFREVSRPTSRRAVMRVDL
ncbi:GNAT family N-acetyltransferase [Isoptericola sp. QY 916]|uniref:GNAT family N-acetyltransferase n=1 Tax=Isoptericola sp. QY 916 TaxID=2782570 RepID=UPI003D2FA734|nr:GNAT family N-acetyltransferase [Isoptericola sp. QY 916]